MADNSFEQPLSEDCENRLPKNRVTYVVQVLTVFTIVVASLIQLSLGSTDKELWLVLLSTSVGYILPSPGLKYYKADQNRKKLSL